MVELLGGASDSRQRPMRNATSLFCLFVAGCAVPDTVQAAPEEVALTPGTALVVAAIWFIFLVVPVSFYVVATWRGFFRGELLIGKLPSSNAYWRPKSKTVFYVGASVLGGVSAYFFFAVTYIWVLWLGYINPTHKF